MDEMYSEILAKARQEKEIAKFVAREARRMRAIPEPIFVLNLPDSLIHKLMTAHEGHPNSIFDTVGKILMAVMVNGKQMLCSDPYAIGPIQYYHREYLQSIISPEEYNLIGSRLISFGYLQHDLFLSGLEHQPTYRPGKG